MDKATFENLRTEEVARLMSKDGPKVCGFPINGTRRWFLMEHQPPPGVNPADAYIEAVSDSYIELLRMLFDHGIDVILAPVFGPDLLDRGPGYQEVMEKALVGFASNQDFLDFYSDYEVRVRVYGDAERFLAGTRYDHVLHVYDELTQRTAEYEQRKLFFGVCAHDPAETIAAIGVSLNETLDRLPTRQEIVEAYYGEYVPPVDIFIGFADRHAVFDMPLVATGTEDLYFTVNPSPRLDAHTLRTILHDHLFVRGASPKYEDLGEDEWEHMKRFYDINRGHVQGIGASRGGIWYPLPQVVLTEDFWSDS